MVFSALVDCSTYTAEPFLASANPDCYVVSTPHSKAMEIPRSALRTGHGSCVFFSLLAFDCLPPAVCRVAGMLCPNAQPCGPVRIVHGFSCMAPGSGSTSLIALFGWFLPPCGRGTCGGVHVAHCCTCICHLATVYSECQVTDGIL